MAFMRDFSLEEWEADKPDLSFGFILRKTRIMSKSIKNYSLSLLLLAGSFVSAQTWIGNINYRGQDHYFRLKCKDGSCQTLIPGLDNKEQHIVEGNPEQKWSFNRGFEKWEFTTESFTDNQISGVWSLPSGSQPFQFYKQGNSIPRDQQHKYSGTYQNAEGNVTVMVYPQRGFLRIESSISEMNSSLKPLVGEEFWGFGGERLKYSNSVQAVFQSLDIVSKDGIEYSLTRQKEPTVTDVMIPAKGDTLHGKIYVPDAPLSTLLPACLILPSAGNTTMKNNEYEANWLAAHGVVCLIFDKPGTGHSTAHMNFETASFREKEGLYNQVGIWLSQHPRVEIEKVGIHGASQSGRIGMMMLQGRPALYAFGNFTAAPFVGQKEQQLYAIAELNRQRGLSEEMNLRVLNVWQDYMQGVIDSNISQDIVDQINELSTLQSDLHLPPASAELPGSPRAVDLVNDRILTDSKKTRRPVLLQYGDLDQRVNGHRSVELFLAKPHLKKAMNIRFYPGANHSFMLPDRSIARGYLTDKTNWLRSIGMIR
jgi:dienelactone hydrolase